MHVIVHTSRLCMCCSGSLKCTSPRLFVLQTMPPWPLTFTSPSGHSPLCSTFVPCLYLLYHLPYCSYIYIYFSYLTLMSESTCCHLTCYIADTLICKPRTHIFLNLCPSQLVLFTISKIHSNPHRVYPFSPCQSKFYLPLRFSQNPSSFLKPSLTKQSIMKFPS